MNRDCTLGLLIGLGAGVAVGVLCAPKSGSDLRRFHGDKTKQGVDSVQEQAAHFRDAASELVEKGRAEITRTQDGLRNALEAGKRAYQESAG